MGPGPAASIVLTIASLVCQLLDESGLRPHGEIHQGTILVSPGGAVALTGSGHPILQSLLIPAAPSSLDVPRAPELTAGHPPTPAADVYALASVYAQLLAGRRASTPAPNVIPDPRPSLVRLLKHQPGSRPRRPTAGCSRVWRAVAPGARAGGYRPVECQRTRPAAGDVRSRLGPFGQRHAAYRRAAARRTRRLLNGRRSRAGHGDRRCPAPNARIAARDSGRSAASQQSMGRSARRRRCFGGRDHARPSAARGPGRPAERRRPLRGRTLAVDAEAAAAAPARTASPADRPAEPDASDQRGTAASARPPSGRARPPGTGGPRPVPSPAGDGGSGGPGPRADDGVDVDAKSAGPDGPPGPARSSLGDAHGAEGPPEHHAATFRDLDAGFKSPPRIKASRRLDFYRS